jgi:hypothetical protein
MIVLFERIHVLTVASMKMTALWDTVPCRFIEVHRRFRHEYCLHHRLDDGGSM